MIKSDNLRRLAVFIAPIIFILVIVLLSGLFGKSILESDESPIKIVSESELEITSPQGVTIPKEELNNYISELGGETELIEISNDNNTVAFFAKDNMDDRVIEMDFELDREVISDTVAFRSPTLTSDSIVGINVNSKLISDIVLEDKQHFLDLNSPQSFSGIFIDKENYLVKTKDAGIQIYSGGENTNSKTLGGVNLEDIKKIDKLQTSIIATTTQKIYFFRTLIDKLPFKVLNLPNNTQPVFDETHYYQKSGDEYTVYNYLGEEEGVFSLEEHESHTDREGSHVDVFVPEIKIINHNETTYHTDGKSGRITALSSFLSQPISTPGPANDWASIKNSLLISTGGALWQGSKEDDYGLWVQLSDKDKQPIVGSIVSGSTEIYFSQASPSTTRYTLEPETIMFRP